MPRDVALLTRLFPTLLRVPAVQQMPEGLGATVDDPSLLRARAFGALKELLARAADRNPLILCFDDLQWADDDSAELMRELFRAPSAPACLFVCVISEPERASAAPPSWLLRNELPRFELSLAPLSPVDAATLARSWLGPAGTDAEVSLLVEESAGHPLLLRELSLEASSRGAASGMHDTVTARLTMLDADARSLLEVTCVAGQPIELSLAERAAGVQAPTRLLERASWLVRVSEHGGREYLESAHERIREAVLDNLAATRRAQLHLCLAEQLAHESDADPEQIADHYRAAGKAELSASYTLRAADRATRTFALARAVKLYEQALRELPSAGNVALEIAYANALSATGALARAADSYERVLPRIGSREQQRELTARAMVLHLLCGQIDRGSHLLRKLSSELGVLPVPENPWLARVVRMWLIIRYLLQRPAFRVPTPSESRHTPESRARLDLCLRAGRGFAHVSFEHGEHYALLGALAIRKRRDVAHWPIVIAWDVIARSIYRGRSTARDGRHMARAIELARFNGDREVLAVVLSADGSRRLYTGDFRECIRSFERAEEAVGAQGRSVASVFNGTRSGRFAGWMMTGEVAEIAAHAEPWLKDAQLLGNQFGELIVHVMGSHRFLARGDLATARASVGALTSELGKQTLFGADAWWFGELALYEGKVDEALSAHEQARRSPHFRQAERTAMHRTFTSLFHARTALLAARTRPGERARWLALAEREGRRLGRERLVVSQAALAQVSSGIALLRGRRDYAVDQLTRAHALYERGGSGLHAAATSFWLGKLVGGEAGRARASAAERRANELGISRPEPWFRMVVTGFAED